MGEGHRLLTGEVWVSLPGFASFYEVSSFGRVRSRDRRVLRGDGAYCKKKGVLKKQCIDQGGYPTVTLYANGRKTTVDVHRLICMAFHGPAPGDGYQAAHIDGNKQNNQPNNLYWATVSQNAIDKTRHGRNYNANKTHCKHGHEFTPDNTVYERSRGRWYRQCRTCSRIRKRTYRMKRRAA